ncbi:MAG: trigger factor, partial [bacterium]
MNETQVTVEEIGATRRRLDVEVPVAAVAAEMERAFGRVQRQARVKGFRPGRVPRAVLERYFGDQVRADVLSHLIEHSYSDALSRVGLRPVGPPEIVPENIEAGRPLRYSATIDIWPEIEIRDAEGLPARRSRRQVGDAEVERAVEHLRESLAEL